jgi:hypothetical protein
MGLVITHAHDPILIEQIVLTLYSGPGLGKTTLGFTADHPLLLDFDGGVHRAKNRGDAVRVTRWTDVAMVQASDVSGYKTLVVDTAGRALDRLSEKLIADDPRNANPSGGLSLPGFGALKTTFAAWLKRVQGFGLDIVLIAHGSEERKGDDVIERLDIQGGSRGEVHKLSDAMGRIYLDSSGARWLTFSPSDAAFGKNPAQLEPMPVPHYLKEPHWLAGVIATIKRSLNEQSEEARAAQAAIAARRESFEALIVRREDGEMDVEATCAAWSEQAKDLSAKAKNEQADQRLVMVEKALLVQVAKQHGCVYDREVAGFVLASEAAPEPPPAQPPTPPEPAQAPARRGRGGRRAA